MKVNIEMIGKRIRELRESQGYSQSKLAETINVSTSYISPIENGKKQASLEIYIAIANELGVTLDELLYGNLINNPTEYFTDMDLLLSDCDALERRIIFETSRAIKEILRANLHLYIDSIYPND